MYITLTDQDRKKLQKIVSDYNRKITEAQELLQKFSDDKNSEEWEKAKNSHLKLIEENIKAIEAFHKQIERREFSKFDGDRDKIMKSAEEQVRLFIDDRYNFYDSLLNHKEIYVGDILPKFYNGVRIDGNDLYLDVDVLFIGCKQYVLSLHYESLSYSQDAIDQLDNLVYTIISESPKTSSDKGVPTTPYISEENKLDLSDNERELERILVNYPASYISPIDKVSNQVFLGDFQPGTGKSVNVQQKKLAKKSPVYTLIAINFEELKDVRINGRKELTPYDREVHDTITTLYIEGGNTYITVNMIYQMMTGKKDAHCSPKQAQAISDSITKLMYSHAVIDAREEAKYHGLDKARYDSNIINAKRLTISANGQTVEAIKVLDSPILYDYANRKNGIGRYDAKLLNSPVSKTEENIILEGYLRRRIDSIKKNSDLSPTIKYETIYKQLDISAGSESSLRNKKMKVRNTVKKILDFYKQEQFIKGYVENSHKGEKNKIDSVTIRY